MEAYRKEWCYWKNGIAFRAFLTGDGKWHYNERNHYYPIDPTMVPLSPCIVATDLFVNAEAPVWNSDGTLPLYASPILHFHEVK